MATEDMLIKEIIWGCWVVFTVYWMISARFVKAVVEKQNPAASLVNRIPRHPGLHPFIVLAVAGIAEYTADISPGLLRAHWRGDLRPRRPGRHLVAQHSGGQSVM